MTGWVRRQWTIAAHWVDPCELGTGVLIGAYVATLIGVLIGLALAGPPGAVVVGGLTWLWRYASTCNELGILK